jgi:hypothetical protein
LPCRSRSFACPPRRRAANRWELPAAWCRLPDASLRLARLAIGGQR